MIRREGDAANPNLLPPAEGAMHRADLRIIVAAILRAGWRRGTWDEALDAADELIDTDNWRT